MAGREMMIRIVLEDSSRQRIVASTSIGVGGQGHEFLLPPAHLATAARP